MVANLSVCVNSLHFSVHTDGFRLSLVDSDFQGTITSLAF